MFCERSAHLPPGVPGSPVGAWVRANGVEAVQRAAELFPNLAADVPMRAASTTPRPPPNSVDVHARYPAMAPEGINSHTRMGHIAPARRGVSARSRDHGESWTRTQRHRAEEERASRGCGISVESPACADSIGLLVSRRRDV